MSLIERPPPLMDYVKRLENRSNQSRREAILGVLANLGIKVTIRGSGPLKIKNIIADFRPDVVNKKLIFTAHYDGVRESPAANDNASGVAVLLGLCRELSNTRLPVKVIFFDREEAWLRTRRLKLGLLGSLHYVFTQTLGGVGMVFNLEFCGHGDCLAIWPVKTGEANRPAARSAIAAAATSGINWRTFYIPWFYLSSDHLSFRLRGVTEAVTLSLIPSIQLPLLDGFVSGLNTSRLGKSGRPELPGLLADVHSPKDTSDKLDSESLALMLSLTRSIWHSFESNTPMS